MRSIKWIALAVAGTLFINACNNNKDDVKSGMYNLEVRLTDAPYDATEVNVDIAKVQVHLNNDPNGGWYDLNTMAGVHNLLALQNGVNIVLATGPVPGPNISEIRLVLNDKNSIVIDDVLYPLTIPSGSESGLKIKLDKKLTQPSTTLIIDFDAGLSIHQTGNGKYMLRPVIKLK